MSSSTTASRQNAVASSSTTPVAEPRSTAPPSLPPSTPSPSPSASTSNPLVLDKPLKEGDFKIANWRFYCVCLMLVSEAIASTMLYSYVGLFVAHIEPRLTRSTAGYIAGFLVGAYQAAQVVALPLWGRLSDRVGRIPVLLLASSLSVIAAVMFGCASSFYWAMIARAFHGLVGGGTAMAKTYIYEVTDEHSQARGFGLLNLMWAVGSFIGPSIGGFLYDANESPIFSRFLPRIALFDTHPALPPALAMGSYAAFAALMTFLFVPESNKNAVPLGTVLADTVAWLRSLVGVRAYRHVPVDEGGAEADAMDSADVDEATEENNNGAEVTVPSVRDAGAAQVAEDCDDGERFVVADCFVSGQERTPMLVPSHSRPPTPPPAIALAPSDAESASREASTEKAPSHAVECKAEGDDGEGEKKAVTEVDTQPDDGYLEFHKEVDEANERLNAMPSVTMWQVCSHPLLRIAIPMYMMLCAFNIAYNEVFPLFSVAYRSDGGLGFSSTQVGFAGMINAIVSVLANMVFSRVSKAVPMMKLWACCNAVAAVAMFSAGFFSYLPSPEACLVVFLPFCVLRTTSSGWAFAVNMMFTANAAPKKHLGLVTSTTMAGASVARSLTPMIAAPIFAWSISVKHIFPFNHFLLFILAGFVALSCVWLGRYLPQQVIGIRRK